MCWLKQLSNIAHLKVKNKFINYGTTDYNARRIRMDSDHYLFWFPLSYAHPGNLLLFKKQKINEGTGKSES